ncbi:MAG TPA: hypothetical protein VG106_00290 [Vicinamibacterales bacterium]|nr:hypothetical protein [Vicinamibacterales bacterium]
MRHGLMYQGGFEVNFATLEPGALTFRTSDGAEQRIPAWPETVDGVRFGYMERRGRKFLVVRIQFDEHDVVLRTPVALDRMRHMGNQRFAPRPILLSDANASALLDDVIECNPEQSTEIALLINRVNQVRRGGVVSS